MLEAAIGIEPSGRRRTLIAALVEPQPEISHSGPRRDAGNNQFSVGLSGNGLRIYERYDLDMLQPGLRQRIDQFDFPRRSEYGPSQTESLRAAPPP